MKATYDNYPERSGCDAIVGGLVGRVFHSTISYCETRGSVVSATSVGGSVFGFISDGSVASHINGKANISRQVLQLIPDSRKYLTKKN